MTKKAILTIILSCLLVSGTLLPPAFAADELTAQEKYDNLVEKGIFTGLPGGDPGLDQDMTRAQFARVAALIMELDVDTKPKDTSFIDVNLNHWAIEEINAVNLAGFMIGHGDGTFEPEGEVTIEQLAKVIVKMLNIEVDMSVEVEGASDWAMGYVAAAISAGLIEESIDYTQSVDREQLVNASYTVEPIIENIKPTLAALGDISGIEGKAVEFTVSGADEDGEVLVYSASGLPTGISIDSQSGVVSGTPDTVGTFNVTITVTDSATGQASQSFDWVITEKPKSEPNSNSGSGSSADTTPPTVTIDTYGAITVGESVYATSNEDGYIYLMYINEPGISSTELEEEYSASDNLNKTRKIAAIANESMEILTVGLEFNDYFLYAVDAAGNVSELPRQVWIEFPY